MANKSTATTARPQGQGMETTLPEFPLTDEQAQLLIAIVSKLDVDAIHGRWPHQLCKHCSGRSVIHPDEKQPQQIFQHDASCIVLLIEQLRATVTG